RHFWRALGGEGELSDELVARLDAYDWPGNVRELHNAVARLFALGDLALMPEPRGGSIAPGAAGAPGAGDAGAGAADSIDRVLALDLPLARARQQVLT